jgi:hypothetical protein
MDDVLPRPLPIGGPCIPFIIGRPGGADDILGTGGATVIGDEFESRGRCWFTRLTLCKIA